MARHRRTPQDRPAARRRTPHHDAVAWLLDAQPGAPRSFLELEQIDALLRAAALAETAHRGLTWEKVARIRSSDASAVALARELGVSDTLIGKVRRRELWNERAEPRSRHDVPRRIAVETLILAGPRISEFCGLSAHHLDLAGGRLRIPGDVTKTDAGERSIPLVPGLREHLTDHRLDFLRQAASPLLDPQPHAPAPRQRAGSHPRAAARARQRPARGRRPSRLRTVLSGETPSTPSGSSEPEG